MFLLDDDKHTSEVIKLRVGESVTAWIDRSDRLCSCSPAQMAPRVPMGQLIGEMESSHSVRQGADKGPRGSGRLGSEGV